MSPARPPRETGRAGIRNAALRPASADQGAVPAALQAAAESGTVPQARDELAQVTRQVRPTRITVDLVAELHLFLRGYVQARDVAAADVIRELIRQLRADPDLSARVTAELERRREALAEAIRAARE